MTSITQNFTFALHTTVSHVLPADSAPLLIQHCDNSVR